MRSNKRMIHVFGKLNVKISKACSKIRIHEIERAIGKKNYQDRNFFRSQLINAPSVLVAYSDLFWLSSSEQRNESVGVIFRDYSGIGILGICVLLGSVLLRFTNEGKDFYALVSN